MKTYTLFAGDLWVATGDEGEIAAAVNALGKGKEATGILIFDDETGRQTDIDVRPEKSAGEGGQAAAGKRTRGRPSLGVVAREVTLLPRHWDWLNQQPEGASAALRKLVEAARKAGSAEGRQSRDAAYHFMHAIAGDRPGYEEALRALFAGESARLAERIADWPVDIRTHVMKLAYGAEA